ncbi:hypothetical protein HZA33_05435 [Candidatus Pacearchaeota archaeon]|nr:hypothetical protein [Candidatus Pacearchaeota archaeon]
MASIILDSNFLIYCAQYKIDYESEILRLFDKYTILISDQVLDELEDLSSNRVGKEKAVIELAIAIVEDKIKKNKVKVIEITSDTADFSVIELALKNKEPVIASLDEELRKEANKRLKNAQFLSIRQKTHLNVINLS